MTATNDALLSVSITAGAIQSHNPPIDDRHSHQLRINSTSFIHFTPEVAALWLPVLAEIAAEKPPKSPDSRGFLVE